MLDYFYVFTAQQRPAFVGFFKLTGNCVLGYGRAHTTAVTATLKRKWETPTRRAAGVSRKWRRGMKGKCSYNSGDCFACNVIKGLGKHVFHKPYFSSLLLQRLGSSLVWVYMSEAGLLRTFFNNWIQYSWAVECRQEKLCEERRIVEECKMDKHRCLENLFSVFGRFMPETSICFTQRCGLFFIWA